MDNFKEGRNPADIVVSKAELLYPIVLLIAFITGAAVHSIITSRTEEELVTPVARGPGGKPLPLTKRKREHEDHALPEIPTFSDGARRAFQYVSAGIVLTFVVNAVAIAIHALRDRAVVKDGDGWWCGEERTVRRHLPLPPQMQSLITSPLVTLTC